MANYGMRVNVKYSPAKDGLIRMEVLRNVTEIHYNFESVIHNQIAFESDIHSNGITIESEDLIEYEAINEEGLADSFWETPLLSNGKPGFTYSKDLGAWVPIPAEMDKIPVVKQAYVYRDDGKRNNSRMSEVVIKGIVPFDYADRGILLLWDREVAECPWLYAAETDYFVIATLFVCPGSTYEIVFARTVQGQWFSMGMWSGLLDMEAEIEAPSESSN